MNTTSRTIAMGRVGLALLTVGLIGAACGNGERPATGGGDKPAAVDAGGSPAAPSAADAGQAAAPIPKVALGVEPPPDFDPMAACADPEFKAEDIPPVPVRGLFVKDGGEDLEVALTIIDGRLELGEDRVQLGLSSEPMRHCTPFREDGELATRPRMGVRLGGLEKGSWRFPGNPESSEAPFFRYFNYVYQTDTELPMTINAFSTEDSGVISVEEIMLDEESNLPMVAGRLLVCKRRGELGWAVGRFEVPLCDQRPMDKRTPLDISRPSPDGAAPEGEAPDGQPADGVAPDGQPAEGQPADGAAPPTP